MAQLNQHKMPIEARDFESIRDAFEQFALNRFGGDLDDLTITELQGFLMDLQAFFGDAFYREAERAGAEQNFAGAVEPQTILDISLEQYGYIPPGVVSSVHNVDFSVNSADEFTILAGTRCSTSPAQLEDTQIFEVTEDLAKVSGVAVLAGVVRHGITRNQVSTATGDPNLLIDLTSAAVDLATTELVIDGLEWERVETWARSLPTSTHFRVVVTETVPGERRYKIQTGNGILGLIPVIGSNLEITYVSGGGSKGNVSVGAIDKLLDQIRDGSNNPVAVSVSNTSATVRGVDEEHVDITKVKAPLLATIHGGVVSTEDYSAAAILKGAARAKAYTDQEISGLRPNQVLTLVVLDLVTLPTDSETDAIRYDIVSDFKSNGTANLVVSGAEFLDVTLDMVLYVSVGFSKETVQAEAQSNLDFFFSLSSTTGPIPEFTIDIGRNIPLSHVVNLMEPVDGVSKVVFPSIAAGFDSILSETNKILRVTVNLSSVQDS